jgi:hypothetical protein
MADELLISRYSAWAPGITNGEEWKQWAEGKRPLEAGSESPEIAFTDPLFRRRLSQISRMTIQVVHDLLPVDNETKLLFLSFRGELTKSFKVKRMVIEEKSVMPAAFSQSLFNIPIAMASMAFGLKGGYSAVFPGRNSFYSGLAGAKASLLCGTSDSLVFVYADEKLPQEYECFFPASSQPPAFAFAVLFTRNPDKASFKIPFSEEDSPQDFLKKLIFARN